MANLAEQAFAHWQADEERELQAQIGPQSIGAHVPLKIDYVNDAPDVREYLVNLRRDLLRKVKQLDELIGRIDCGKSQR